MAGRNFKRSQTGATLAAVMILILAGTALGISALHSATTEAQLSGTLTASRQAFWLAERGIAAGINFALTRPAELPTDVEINIPTPVDPLHGRVETAIHPGDTDAHCPALAPADAIRKHYEIHATAYADRGAISMHVQGFYICSEICTASDCIVPEYPLVRSYWKAGTGGFPP